MSANIKNNQSQKANKSYYFDSDKFVRDLIHGYVYLTKFDIDLISTEQFQRLRDIRQLTCQSVYPAARHTRFEHSLGVMELTRQAINNINANGFIALESPKAKIIDEQLQFNAALAALLHDVGHCPFSHMGEVEFDSKDVWDRLYSDINDCEELRGSDLSKIFENMNQSSIKKAGSIHEQLSCIMILEKLKGILSDVGQQKIVVNNGSNLYVDYELIIRCILGIEYNTSTIQLFESNKEKNIVVNLINSKIFDMDKLDYVMRDSFYTGIGTPHIDTNRLFRNMYLNSENEYKLVFKNRAVPALQNFIESRDSLYMYVYNHHTAVFSDFMNGYIFRRLAHNKRDLLELSLDYARVAKEQGLLNEINDVIIAQLEETLQSNNEPITTIGMIPKDYLFSSEAVIDQTRSDSDLISLLNILHYSLDIICKQGDYLEQYIDGEISEALTFPGFTKNIDHLKKIPHLKEKYEKLKENIFHINQLISEYQCHQYLKPWWKTNSEFNNFLMTNFKDDRICLQLCNWISHGKSGLVDGEEFRSQLAKNVIFITQCLKNDNEVKSNLITELNTGEFFVIKRSARFFDPDTISELDIALKSNEILGSPRDVKYQSGEFYIKMLTNVIPQRDYYSMYAKNSFYIFSKRLSNDLNSLEQRNAHYRQIEQIFIFVAETLISDGERNFMNNYSGSKEKEKAAHQFMYERYKKDILK